jgi:hypothetical protein
MGRIACEAKEKIAAKCTKGTKKINHKILSLVLLVVIKNCSAI